MVRLKRKARQIQPYAIESITHLVAVRLEASLEVVEEQKEKLRN